MILRKFILICLKINLIVELTFGLHKVQKKKGRLNKKGFKAYVMPYSRKNDEISKNSISKNIDYLDQLKEFKSISNKKTYSIYTKRFILYQK